MGLFSWHSSAQPLVAAPVEASSPEVESRRRLPGEGSGGREGRGARGDGTREGRTGERDALRDPVASPASPASPGLGSGERLLQLCGRERAQPQLRPLAAPLRILVAALQRHGNSTSSSGSRAAEALRGAVDSSHQFLEPAATATRHLEFALAAHTRPEAREAFFAGVDAAFSASCEELLEEAQAACPSVRAAQEQWRTQAVVFAKKCREIWEFHCYFIFLDVKGDRALFEQTARRLCSLLECPVRSLVSSFVHTRPWAESALRALARREHQTLLASLHAEALKQWQTAWQERLQQAHSRDCLSEEHGTRFWDSYFTHLFKISWPDFVEAFEQFYRLGRCPVDLAWQLRLRVDRALVYQVSRSSWQSLLQVRSRIIDILELLLGEVLEDPSSRIYRPHPLLSSNSAEKEKQPAGAGEEAAEEARARTRAQAQEQAQEQPPSRPGSPNLRLGLPRQGAEANASAAAFAAVTVLGQHEGEGQGRDTGGGGSRGPLLASSLGREQQAVGPATEASGRSGHGHGSSVVPWFPFAQGSGDDGDMAIPTPTDTRLRPPGPDQPQVAGGPAQQQAVPWDDFVSRLCSQHQPWWGTPTSDTIEEPGREPLQVAALREVCSTVACTRRALVFRVVSGDLAQNRPAIELPQRTDAEGSEASEPPLLPSLVVSANGTRFSRVTKFGRSSSRRALLPDCPMSEPIASRSHFNVVYEQELDRYFLMDAGSKWGTFVKICSSVTLNCGDWIRVGGVEFIIRYCGGGCACHKRHAHYRLHSLRLLREHQGAGARRSCAGFRLGSASQVPGVSGVQGLEGAASSEEDESGPQFQDELLLLLSSRRPRGWTAASARFCQQTALAYSANSPSSAPPSEVQDSGASASASASSASAPASACRGVPSPSPSWRRRALEETQGSPSSPPPATLMPIAPLELDFISGPRMGEKLVLCERVCTLGRGEGNTIQVSDSQIASVSRVHCIFEYTGNRWMMRDNGSTNGTWRRLSCVLEPSEPIPIFDGMSIQAGVHEFLVEEADMKRWCLPSATPALFEELCEQDRREQHLPPQHLPLHPPRESAGMGMAVKQDTRSQEELF